MRWRLCVVLLVGCEAPLAPPPPAPVQLDAPPSAFPLGRIRGTIGRGVAPQRVGYRLAGVEPAQVPQPACDIALVGDKLQKQTKPIWTAAVAKTDAIVSVDACRLPEAPIVVTVVGEHGTALVAIDRATGKVLGRIDGITGVWTARTDEASLEVATPAGVTRWDRALSQPQPLELPPLGALIAEQGDRRLVRATPLTAVLLDREGIAAYVPMSEASAELGAKIATSARSLALPPRWRGPLALSRHAPLAVPAELRDLPAPVTAPAPTAAPFDLGTKLVAPVVVDRAMYVATDAGVAALDLATRTWGWHVAGNTHALVASPTTVAFATESEIVILDRNGSERKRLAATADTLELAGVLLIARSRSAARIYDAVTGAELGQLASDDGAPVRAAAFALEGMELVIAYERDRIVARLPRVWMLPAWSVAVAGVVTAIAPSGEGALIALEDGDAYRLDARTGVVTAMPGIGLLWHASGDAVTGEAPGGPVPPAVIVPPAGPPEKYVPTDLEAAPAIATPWPAPPPLPASWQLTIYDLAGGVRARNDYAVTDPVAGWRGPGAPFVFTSGAEALVIDSAHGDPLRRVTLPGPGRAFSTIVDGRAIVGMILAAPLRLVVF